MTDLSQTAPGSLHCDLALIVNSSPDIDGFTRDVTSPVQSHPAGHRPGGQTGHTQLVLNLTVERLLNINIISFLY